MSSELKMDELIRNCSENRCRREQPTPYSHDN